MSAGEALAFKAMAEITVAERTANARRDGATDPTAENEATTMAGLAVFIVGLGERIAAIGRRLGHLDVPTVNASGESPSVVRPF